MKEKKQFLVIGLGRFGTSVAVNLVKLGHEVLAVDSSEDAVDAVSPYVTQAIAANATDEAVLRSIGPRNFDVAVVSIGQNIQDSILIAMLCKEMGVPYLVGKATDELHAKVLRKVGVDRVVFPERDMGQRVAKSLVSPNFLELLELSGEYQMVEMTTPTVWKDRTLVEANVRRNYGVSVIGIRRNEQFIASPGAEEKLLDGDVLLLLGRQEDLEKLPK